MLQSPSCIPWEDYSLPHAHTDGTQHLSFDLLLFNFPPIYERWQRCFIASSLHFWLPCQAVGAEPHQRPCLQSWDRYPPPHPSSEGEMSQNTLDCSSWIYILTLLVGNNPAQKRKIFYSINTLDIEFHTEEVILKYSREVPVLTWVHMPLTILPSRLAHPGS